MEQVLTIGIVLPIYFNTLYASIPGGDSGELVAEACALGHAHPPGYPLFTVVYHWFIKYCFQDKEIAWRANALSAIFGAICAGLITGCTKSLISHFCLEKDHQKTIFSRFSTSLFAIFSGVMYAFSPLIWLYSTGAEVFAMNNFFASLVVWLTIQYALCTNHHMKTLFIMLGAFVSGLSLCNQHTMFLFLIPLIGWIFSCEVLDNEMSTSKFLSLAFCFFAGLIPYAYLPYASFHRIQGSWGDSSTFASFFHHLRRGDYGTFQLYSGNDAKSESMLERSFLYLGDLISRQGLFGIVPVFAVLAIWALLQKPNPSRHTGKSDKRQGKKSKVLNVSSRREGTLILALAGTWLFYTMVFHALSNMPLHEGLLFGVQARFWMQPNVIVFIFSGVGIFCAVSTFGSHSNMKHLLAMIVCAVIMFCQCQWHYEESDQSTNNYFELYGKAIMAAVPANSLLLVSFDHHWTSLRYLQQCKNLRKDITIMNSQMMTYKWLQHYTDLYNNDPTTCVTLPGTHWILPGSSNPQDQNGFTTAQLVKANLGRCIGGVYYSGDLPFAKIDSSHNKTFLAVTHGLVKRFVPRKSDVTDGIEIIGFDAWFEEAVHSWDSVAKVLNTSSLPNLSKYSDETWEWVILRDYFDQVTADAANVLHYSIILDEVNTILFAAFMLHLVENSHASMMRASDFKNLGLAYLKVVQSKSTSAVARKALSHNHHIRALFGHDSSETITMKTIKDVSANRVPQFWKQFLSMEDASTDTGYEEVKRIMDYLDTKTSK